MFLLLRYARTAYITAAPPPDATHRPPPVPEGVDSLGPCYCTIMCSPLGGKDTAAGPRNFLKIFRRHRWAHQRDGAKYSTPYTTDFPVLVSLSVVFCCCDRKCCRNCRRCCCCRSSSCGCRGCMIVVWYCCRGCLIAVWVCGLSLDRDRGLLSLIVSV